MKGLEWRSSAPSLTPPPCEGGKKMVCVRERKSVRIWLRRIEVAPHDRHTYMCAHCV